MRRKWQGLVAGIMVGIMLVGSVAYAKQIRESINVAYNNIKIIIDGKEFVAKDVNGIVVEPFVYEGTTYLPVRAIASAFDKDVDWEAQTCTVTIGSKNYDWLDQIGFADYKYSAAGNSFTVIPTGSKAADGIKYDRGIRFDLDAWDGLSQNNDTTAECYECVSYMLNGEYKTFEGTVAFFDGGTYPANAIIKIYGDGNLLYTSPVVSQGTKSTNFNIDVSDIKLLKINVELLNIGNIFERASVGIADARLCKK